MKNAVQFGLLFLFINTFYIYEKIKFKKSLFWVIMIGLANLSMEINAQNSAVLKDWKFRQVGRDTKES